MTGATNAYALQLTGEGDPTGIKEGFSLVTLTRKQIGESESTEVSFPAGTNPRHQSPNSETRNATP
jgi:hypothetical protein